MTLYTMAKDETWERRGLAISMQEHANRYCSIMLSAPTD